jgi:hypothetical protein
MRQGNPSVAPYDASMGTLDAAAIAYVRHVLQVLNLSPRALAQKARLAPSTIARPLNDPDHKFVLSTSTIQKIATATGINPAPFLAATDVPQLATAPKRGENQVAVVCELAAKWVEVSAVPAGPFPARFVPLDLRHSVYRPDQCFACVMGDDSADYWVRAGETLFCVRLDALQDVDMEHDRLVIVERRDPSKFKVELTARELIREKDGWELRFGTKRKGLADIVKLKSLGPAGNLNVVGAVEFILREPLGPRWARRISASDR